MTPSHQFDSAANPHTPQQGWQNFYAQLTSDVTVPNANWVQTKSNNFSVVAPYLDLATVYAQAAQAGTALVSLFCDVLSISGSVAWPIQSNQAVMVYARYIDFQPGASWNVVMQPTGSGSSALMVFGGSTNGTANVWYNTQQQTITDGNISPGIGMTASAAGLEVRHLQLSDGIPTNIPDTQAVYLRNGFIYGALASDGYLAIAADILQWVNMWAAQITSSTDSELAQLYFDTSMLTAQVQAEYIASENNAVWVPFLSRSVYADLATTLSNKLSTDQTNYLILFAAQEATQEFITAAQALATTYGNDVARDQALLTQAQADYQNALAALQVGQNNFSTQQQKIGQIGINLAGAIQAWENANRIQAALQIASAIIGFGVGIAEMCVGDPAGATAAAQSAANAAKVGAKIADVMQGLIYLAKVIQQCYALAQQLYQASQSLQAGGGIDPATAAAQSAQLGQNDPINGMANWDTFATDAAGNLSALVKLGINYAQQYSDALVDLATYGKALCSLQLAVIQASQKCVALAIRIFYDQKNTSAIQAEVAQLTVDSKQITMLQQMFFRRALNDRLTLYAVLKAYRATYYYWSLIPSDVQASLRDLNSLTQAINTDVQLSFDNYRALANGVRQPMSNVEVTITDPAVIGALQQSGATQWNIDLQHPAFANFGRIRFNNVRIWLDGPTLYTPGTRATVTLKFKTSGNYYDRSSNGQFQFAGGGIQKTFEYYVNDPDNPSPAFRFENGSTGSVVIDGGTAPSVGNDYFEPPPFTSWAIDLNGLGNNLNPQAITQIVMQFSGEAVAM